MKTFRPKAVRVRSEYVPDPDEEAAMAKAVEAFTQFRNDKPERGAYYVISSWIIERILRARVRGDAVTLSYELDDSRLRALATTALPAVAERLQACEVDGDKPFYEMTREDAVTVLVAAYLQIDAMVQMDDEPPF